MIIKPHSKQARHKLLRQTLSTMPFQVVPAVRSVRVRTTGVAEDASVRFHGFPSLVNGLAKSHGHRIFVDQVESVTSAGDDVCSKLTPCLSHALRGRPSTAA